MQIDHAFHCRHVFLSAGLSSGRCRFIASSDALIAKGRRHPRCAAISITAGNEVMHSHDDVECEPDTRHDDRPPVIVRRNAVSPGPGLVECGEIAPDRLRRNLPPPSPISVVSVPLYRICCGLHDHLQGATDV